MIKTLKQTISNIYYWIKKKLVQFKRWVILIIFGAAVVAAPLVLPEPPVEIPDEYKLKCDKSRVLFSEDVDLIVKKEDGTFENKGKVKKYLYASNKKVPAIKDEDITKRIKNAQFIKKEKKDGKQEWEGRFYTGEPFYKDGKDWYQTETATTTIEFFNKQMKVSLLDKVLGNKALADSASYFSGAGDGWVTYHAAAWDTAHDASTGDGVNYTGTELNVKSDNGYPMGGPQYFGRGFFPINTGGLPDDASISAATFKFYVTSATSSDNDGDDYIVVIQTDQPSNTQLTTADYNNCGATNNPTEGSDQLDVSSGITTSAYNTWTLNATGRGWISVTGYTKLGMREGHDALDHPISGNNYVGIDGRTSEYADTTYDPYIEITYTSGAPAERRMFLIE